MINENLKVMGNNERKGKGVDGRKGKVGVTPKLRTASRLWERMSAMASG